jgi:hypothetical protein
MERYWVGGSKSKIDFHGKLGQSDSVRAARTTFVGGRRPGTWYNLYEDPTWYNLSTHLNGDVPSSKYAVVNCTLPRGAIKVAPSTVKKCVY